MNLLAGEPFEVEVAPAVMALAADVWAGKRLRAFQAELAACAERFVVVEAATGSGKTLGFFLRFWRLMRERSSKGAILVYPTNQLILDQARQIAAYLASAGIKVQILGEEERTDPVSDPDVVAMVATGDTLAEAAQRDRVAKGTILRRWLDTAPTAGRILITNPDTLWLIAHTRYHHGESIFRELPDFPLLVLDEFHLYSGVTLLHLCFLLHMLRSAFSQVVISSATPSDALSLLESVLGPPTRITASLEPVIDPPGPRAADAGHPPLVRHPVRLQIRFIDRRPGSAPGDAAQLAKAVLDLYGAVRAGSAPIKVVVIVDSVIFAHEVYALLAAELGVERVSAVTGLTPASARQYREVVVGTSAIEVGVDFEAEAVLFTASDAGSFLQRLGRIGRHRPGRAVALVPAETWDGFSKALGIQKGETVRVSHAALTQAVQQALPSLRSYREFAASTAAVILLRSFLRSFLSPDSTPVLGREFEAILSDLKAQVVPQFISEQAMKDASEGPFGAVEVSLARTGFRGDILTLPARFHLDQTRPPVSGTISFLDLHKVEFDLTETPEGVRVEVCDIKKGVWPWFLQAARQIGSGPGVIRPSTVTVRSTNEKLSTALRKLLDGRVFYCSKQSLDWRLNAVPGARGERFYLGPSALLAWYLEREEEGQSARG